MTLRVGIVGLPVNGLTGDVEGAWIEGTIL